MLNVSKSIAQGAGLAPTLLRRAAHTVLDWEVRQKSRFDATDSLGRTLGVFLPRGSVLRAGDVLIAEDGSLIAVRAAPQPVMVVRACAQRGTPFDLLRAAYHLGNRHVPLELHADHLQLEPDHVLAGLLRRMHLIVTEADAAFEPENGAYAQSGHGHGHGHHPTEADKPAVAAAPAQTAAPAPHVHGPDCAHGHGHGHGDGEAH